MVRFIATAFATVLFGLAALFVQSGIEMAMPDLSPWESWGIAGALFIIAFAVPLLPEVVAPRIVVRDSCTGAGDPPIS